MTKRPTVFLGEMTNPEVEAFVAEHKAVIVPIGSTEQHGPHGPLSTDTIVPTEVARRVAPKVGAAVAPSIGYGLSYPHAGFTGVVYLRIPTFMALVEDVAVGLATMGFRSIVFLNGHYDNTLAIAYACANAADRLPDGTRAFPINYWDGLTADEAAEFFGPTSGLHANQGEMSAVMAVDEGLIDLEHANAEMPPFPEVTSQAAVHTAFFFSTPGSVYRATQSGTWGDAREASVEFGQRYLDAVERATLRMLDDIERTFEAMPPR
jgi:creatinine amidohydrolase